MHRVENWMYRQLDAWPLWIVLISVFVGLWIIAETYNIGNP